MKQSIVVLDAICSGCKTSGQVSAATGLPVATVSAYLWSLTRDGFIRRVKKDAWRKNRRGRYSHTYAPVEDIH